MGEEMILVKGGISEKLTGSKEPFSSEDNIVKLRGTIVNKYDTPKCTTITIGITEPTKKGIFSNYPKVYFFKEDDNRADDFMLRDVVEVRAHVVAPRKQRSTGEIYYSQALIGETIDRAKEEFEREFGINFPITRKYAAPMNIAYLHGEVKDVIKLKNDVLHIRIAAFNKSFKNIITITSFSKADIVIEPGENITVFAKINTRRKQVNGKYHFYENVVAQKILRHSVEE